MSGDTFDLFGQPTSPLLPYRENFVTADEAAGLIQAMDTIELTPFRFQGWLGKRLTASFGWHYDFDTGRMATTTHFPEWLLPLRDRAAAFIGLDATELVQALLIRYDPGAGIGWHKDRPAFEHVVGISLGNAATMRFRRRRDKGFERFSAPLAPGSLYHLSGPIRHDWEHSIAPMGAPRWSITFRSLAASFRP
jgi:alkylated DNA repair dioxygenase AlkB